MTAPQHSEEAQKAYHGRVREAEQALEKRVGTGANIAPNEARAARAEYQAAVDAARAELDKSAAKPAGDSNPVRR